MRKTVAQFARIALVATISLCGSICWSDAPTTDKAESVEPPYVPSCITQDTVAGALAPALRDEARPVVIWSDPKWKGAPVVWPLTFTSLGWRKELTALPPAMGPIRIRETSVYTEVILASEEREAALRSAFGTTHPSGFISAPDRKSLVQSFFGLLGSEVRITGDLDAQGPYTDEEKFAPLFDGLVFFSPFGTIPDAARSTYELYSDTPREQGISELALQVRAVVKSGSGIYTVTPYSAIPYTEQDTRGLLAVLRGGHQEEDYDAAIKRLRTHGKEALPLILAEYRRSTDYWRDRITEVLAGIPSPERDKLFIEELHRADLSKPRSGAASRQEMLIKALGKSQSQDAVPELQRFASKGKGELQREARIALNLLGAPAPARSIDTLIRVDPAIQQTLDAADVATSRDAACAVIDQGILPYGPLMYVNSVKKDRTGGHAISGELPDKKGTWEIKVGTRRGDLVAVALNYSCGNLCGAEDVAVLQLIKGRWLVVWYRNITVS